MAGPIEEPRTAHLSLLRSLRLADVFTLANGLCGVAAIFRAVAFAAQGNPVDLAIAFILIVLALVFDVLDGWVARGGSGASPLGRELDSLADVISFGAAPAAIAFAIGLDSAVDQLLLIYFALCGLSRLARFNITAETLAGPTGKVRYFEGTPIPTSILPLTLLLAAYRYEMLIPLRIGTVEVHLATLLFVVSGSLMISRTIRIPKP